MKIAVDAMGGDTAPATIVEGAVAAARKYNLDIILVGIRERLEVELARYQTNNLSIDICNAAQIAGMDEPPSQVIRKKRDSSIWVATDLVKKGIASGVISAGNTGASMAAAFFILGTIKGVERPAIATPLPTLAGTSVMLDVGANVDCTPHHLFQFAIMGHEYAKHILGTPNPKVGLLSIGEEDTKGNEVTKEAFKKLKESPLNFIGNLEGKEVYTGNADVIVCDGFIGNVALKISEGLAEALDKFLKREIAASPWGKIGYLFLRSSFKNFAKKMDYAEYGGAPLLGVNGVSIICHGRSSAKAIKNAIKLAKEFSENSVNLFIQNDIEESMTSFSNLKGV